MFFLSRRPCKAVYSADHCTITLGACISNYLIYDRLVYLYARNDIQNNSKLSYKAYSIWLNVYTSLYIYMYRLLAFTTHIVY